MTLQAEIASVIGNLSLPKELEEPINTARSVKSAFEQSFDTSSTIQVGEKFPSFHLPDASGAEVSSAALLAKGPLLVLFFRGEWCVFCATTLRVLQQHAAAFEAKGVVLVAVSPEVPQIARETVDKLGLQFRVLSDAGNGLARRLGIVWKQPPEMVAALGRLGVDLKEKNGDELWEVPVPSTFLVDREGVVRNAAVEPDFTKRLEPQTMLEWIDQL